MNKSKALGISIAVFGVLTFVTVGLLSALSAGLESDKVGYLGSFYSKADKEQYYFYVPAYSPSYSKNNVNSFVLQIPVPRVISANFSEVWYAAMYDESTELLAVGDVLVPSGTYNITKTLRVGELGWITFEGNITLRWEEPPQ